MRSLKQEYCHHHDHPDYPDHPDCLIPVEGLAGGLRGGHPAQVAAAVEAGLLEIGILHTC